MLGKLFSKSVPAEGTTKGPPGRGLRVGDPAKGEVCWFSNLTLKQKFPYRDANVVHVENRVYYTDPYSSSDIFCMNLDTLDVEKVSSQQTPKPHSNNAMTLVGNTLVFSGGVPREQENVHEIEAFDLNSGTTTVVGKFPGLMDHSADYSPERDALVVFGGLEGDFDVKALLAMSGFMVSDSKNEEKAKPTNKTRLVFMKGEGVLEEEVLQPSGELPVARSNHSTAFANERLFVIYGLYDRQNTDDEVFATENENTPLFVLDLGVSKNGTWSRVDTRMDWGPGFHLDVYKGMLVILGGGWADSNQVLAMLRPEDKELIMVRSKRSRKSKTDSKSFVHKGKWTRFDRIRFSYVHKDMIHYVSGEKKLIARLAITMPDQ